MSAGYAYYDDKTDTSLEDTYKRADAQMYVQKKEKHGEAKRQILHAPDTRT